MVTAKEKLIHTRQGHILEQIDEDIQAVNAIKSKLLYGVPADAREDDQANTISSDHNNKQKPGVGTLSISSPQGTQQNGLLASNKVPDTKHQSLSTETNDNKNKIEAHLPNAHQVEIGSLQGKGVVPDTLLATKFNKGSTTEGNADEKQQKESEVLHGREDTNWNATETLSATVDKSSFRNYIIACDRVKAFYKEQHTKQTFAYNLQARINFKTKVRAKLTIWDALVKLNKLIDESDPDTELSQIDHAIQTAEAIRKEGKPRWMQLVGLIHDLGKLLYFFDAKGQWDVVGDTFPIGCAFSKKIIFHEFFKDNQDLYHPIYKTKYGIYSPHCGLDNVMLSWGHDEYMYHVAKLHSTLPKEALAMIRYHSCYPIHRENAYQYLMNEDDKKLIEAVKAFNPYDLYSKSSDMIDLEKLEPYYHDLIDEFFPNRIVEF